MKQQLISAIRALEDELVKSGKAKTADYFSKAEASVRSECEGNQKELLSLLDQLQNSGSIVQYADFTVKEESLLEKVYEHTKAWKSTMT